MINIISLKNITKIYNGSGAKALDNVDLEIREDEFFCLVGASGSGKSTILKLIARIEAPTSGEINTTEDMGMVFQSGALFPWLTVEENVCFRLRTKGISDLKQKESARKYLDMVKLKNFEDKYPRGLSGGQRQRVGIARALAVEAKILLLDEPFSALDPLTTKELYFDILDIWCKTKKTIVMVSHYLEESILLSDRVGCMKEGKITGIVDIDLKRPRKINDKAFANKLEKIKILF